MSDIEQRITSIEHRIARIERHLAVRETAPADGEEAQTDPYNRAPEPSAVSDPVAGVPKPVASQPRPVASRPAPVAAPRPGSYHRVPSQSSWTATNILGWGGGTALVLAAAYLIMLAIESGWLTPARQVFLAVLGAMALIGTGLKLRDTDRQYASLLPACGIVILFLSVYGAHLLYGLIGTTLAAGSIVVVCAASLWLCRAFDSQLYALFAVVGSYSAPFLLPSLRYEIIDLVIYYSAWSVLFCVYSVVVGSRRVYLLAMYMALVGFDLIWRMTASGEWVIAVNFQFIQFVIFAGCASYFSIKHDDPMTQTVAAAHAPALLIFYALEYSLLQRHLPDLAPWIAVGSFALLAIAYGVARAFLKQPLEGGRWLLSAYAALVLFHAGYLESVPGHWEPWVALLIAPLAVAYGSWKKDLAAIGYPMSLAIGVIFGANYVRVLFNANLEAVPANDLLVIIYAAQLYIGYYFVRRVESLRTLSLLLIYAGHISAMAAAVHIFDARLAVSLTWGILALASVALAIGREDKTLGQSSLLVFAASAIKVFLYDLSGAAPVVRILSLLVLGVTFYIGGWLYRKINELEPAT